MSPFIDKKYFTLDISTYGHITFKFCFKFYLCVAIFGSLSTKIGGWENFFFPQNPLQVILRFLKNGGEINKPDLLNRQGTYTKKVFSVAPVPTADLWFIFFSFFMPSFALDENQKMLLVVQGIHPRPPLRGSTTNNTAFLCVFCASFDRRNPNSIKLFLLYIACLFFTLYAHKKKFEGTSKQYLTFL